MPPARIQDARLSDGMQVQHAQLGVAIESRFPGEAVDQRPFRQHAVVAVLAEWSTALRVGAGFSPSHAGHHGTPARVPTASRWLALNASHSCCTMCSSCSAIQSYIALVAWTLTGRPTRTMVSTRVWRCANAEHRLWRATRPSKEPRQLPAQ